MKKLILTLIMAGLSQVSFATTNQENEAKYQKLITDFRATQKISIPELKVLACDGHMMSQIRLALALKIESANKFEIMFWMTEGAQRGVSDAQYLLSNYYKELGNRPSAEEGYKWFKIFSKSEEFKNAKRSLDKNNPLIEEEKIWDQFFLSFPPEKKNQLEIEIKNWKTISDQKVNNCDVKAQEFIKNKTADEIKQKQIINDARNKLKEDNSASIKNALEELESKTDIKSVYEVSGIYYNLYYQNKITPEQKNKLILNLNELVNKNYPDGLNLLAKIYRDGKLVPKNNIQALIIYKKLMGMKYERAEQNYNSFFNQFEISRLSPEEKTKLINYLETSPENTDKYLLSQIIPGSDHPDSKRLVIIYQNLLKKGDREAMFKLADFYSQERNPLRDGKKSQEFYDSILKSATDEEKLRVANMYNQSYLREKAILVYQELSSKGNKEAKKAAADFYMKREYRDTANPEKGVQIWEELATQGDVLYQGILANFYMTGSGMEKFINYNRALYWNKKLSEESYSYKNHEILVKLYMSGKGTPKNNIEAYKWLYIMETKFNNKSGSQLKRDLENEMSKQDIAKAIELGQNWKRPLKKPDEY